MNKSQLKKRIDSDNLYTLLKNCKFIGFFCVQNIPVNEKILLKKKLGEHGFDYKLIKNTVIFKTVFQALPNMKGLISGSIAICYKKEAIVNTPFNFLGLKEVFSVMRKSKYCFFLGGIYEGSLVNSLFEKKICDLKDKSSIDLEQLSLIQSAITNIIRTTSTSKNQLSFLLSKKS
jgi:ribosomal protein L10